MANPGPFHNGIIRTIGSDLSKFTPGLRPSTDGHQMHTILFISATDMSTQRLRVVRIGRRTGCLPRANTLLVKTDLLQGDPSYTADGLVTGFG